MYLIEGVLFLRKSSMMEFIEKEMEKAARFLNIHKLEILNNEKFLDGMKNIWDINEINL